jgi:hypothetical protein
MAGEFYSQDLSKPSEIQITVIDGTTGETTSHLTRLSKNDSQVIGYSHSTKPTSWQVAGYPAQAGTTEFYIFALSR